MLVDYGYKPPSSELLEELDWFSFVCAYCGETTNVGKEPTQTTAEFVAMCEWVYGDPPLCTYCARPELLL